MLTDLQIRNLKSENKIRKVKDHRGLYLRVNPGGKKTFFFRYKWLGKEDSITIGEYGQYTLTQAREKRDQFIDDLDAGINPKENKNKGSTFKELADEWFEATKITWTSKTTETTNKKRLSYAIHDLGPKEISSITSKDILDVCRKIEKRGAHETAKRTRAIIGSVFKYNLLFDPSEVVKNSLLTVESKNHSHLTEKEEIKELLEKIDNYHGAFETRMALKFLAYTFVRSRPLREAEWTEIDGDIWRIPEWKEKTRRPLLVPLSNQAQAILNEMREVNGDKQYVFSSNYKDGFMSDSTLSRVLIRMGYLGKQSPHGFRHMASTCLNELEYDGDAIELQLSHAPRGVRGVYNKAKKLSVRTKMMQDWADWLDGL
jgi:integrase